MESSEDKLWATKYLLDPLTAPEPSQETGPGTTHNNTLNAPSRPQSHASEPNPNRSPPAHKGHTNNSSNNRSSYPPPPSYSGSRHNTLPHQQKPGPGADNGGFSTRQSPGRASVLTPASTGNRRQSTDRASTAIPTSTAGRSSQISHIGGDQASFNRQSIDQVSTSAPTYSLFSRFKGDQSHRPLEIIKRDVKLANRAPHLRKNHHVGPDTIDVLDTVGGGYHHEGPFDATLLARNTVFASSPVAAVHGTNLEALKATPRERIHDSLRAHRPLDGVASIPPGVPDRNGRTYHYEEGADLNLEDGADYKRWPGIQYHPLDRKGKGEPSYSIEKALKENKNSHRRIISESAAGGIELTATSGPRPRPSSSAGETTGLVDGEGQRYAEWEGELRRASTTGRRASGGLLKRRLGSWRPR